MPTPLTRRTILGGLVSLPLAGQGSLDKYGGYTARKFEASGFFRLEKADRWWLVTPEGNAFLSWGLNHAQESFLTQEYNRGHWMKRFGASSTKGSRFVDGFRQTVREDMKVYGFNTLGCHNAARQNWPGEYPYVQPFKTVNIDHWQQGAWDSEFRDVFASEFEAHCENRACETGLAQLVDDPYLLGYSFTDCPILTEHDAAARGRVSYGAPRAATTTWPRRLRGLGASAPGKQAYVELMRRRYADDIRAFNRVYDMTFDSFDALLSAKGWRPVADPRNPDEARDNDAFLEQVVDRYYQTMASVIRRHDPNHLILGDKLNGNTDTPGFAVARAARHADLTFFQWYAHYGEQRMRLDEWAGLTGKPLLNGDAAFSCPNEMMPRPNGPRSRTQQERAARMLDTVKASLARPDFVGWHQCGWVDSWKTMPGKEVRQHSGLQDVFGKRYEPMAAACRRVADGLYS